MKSTAAPKPDLSSGDIRRDKLMLAIGSATLVGSYVYPPWTHTGPVMCPFRLLTGIPCPGCGLTRSFCCFAHGDIRGAFSNHLLGPFLAAGVIIGIPMLAMEIITRKRCEP